MSAVISARRLARWYGPVLGVNDLSVDIDPGITGLLGPNGAGKSTFMKIVTGLLRPSRGGVEVLGLTPFANRRLHARLGFCPEHDALYDDLTGAEFVAYLLRLHGFPRDDARRRAAAALDRVGLAEVAGRAARGYSKGMRQRLKLAQAIAHGPELLVVDEPMSGLDPVMRARMIDVFRELRDGGVHVLISTHILHEIEALTDRIVLIHRGRVLAAGSVPEIRALLDRHPRRIRIAAREARALAARLLALPEVVSARVEDGGAAVLVETRDLAAVRRSVQALAAAERPGIRALEVTDAGLEAVFEYLVG